MTPYDSVTKQKRWLAISTANVYKEINEEKIENMEIIELGNRSKLPQSI